MEFLKRIQTFLDVERQFDAKFGVVLEHVFDIAGQEDSLTHGLNRVPNGWRLIDVDYPARIARTAWDTTTITLSSDVSPVTIKIEVF